MDIMGLSKIRTTNRERSLNGVGGHNINGIGGQMQL